MLKRIGIILKNKSGVSIMFVLAVMLLLMTISTSVLVAASAAAGAVVNKQIRNQLNLYAESIQETVMYSLQACGDDVDLAAPRNVLSTGSGPETLGGQLMGVIYQTASNSSLNTAAVTSFVYNQKMDDIVLKPKLDSDAAKLKSIYTNDIVISIEPYAYIRKEYEEEEIIFGSDGMILSTSTSIYPREVTVGARVTVTVIVEHSRKSITSVVVYDYSGGYLQSDGANISIMFIKDAGEWSLVSHEKIDN